MIPKLAVLFCTLLCFIGRPAAGSAEVLTILHINDLHGWLLPAPRPEEGAQEGGLARIAALVERERSPETILLAGGDLMQGTNISNFFGGRPVIEALNAMGLDASAVGNHEFDYGLETFRKRAAEADFPFLAANIARDKTPFLSPYILLERGGVSIAIFGLTTEDTPILTHPENVKALTFLSPRETARDLVPELRRRADLVICLSHLGLAADLELAANIEGIDVIVGGHTHTKMTEPLQVGATVIVQAFERGAFLGRLDLRLEGGRVKAFEGKLLPVDGSAGEDRAVADLVESYRLEAGSRMDEVVGRAAVDFAGAKEQVRGGETNLGSLIADVIREAAAAEAAIMNGGGIGAGIPAGAVTVAHLYNTLPFDSYVVAFSLTGREIRRALERGVSGDGARGGGFPQVSGMAFSFDPGLPPGRRVLEVKVGGELLDDSRLYRVATNDFLAAGGDGYEVFAGKDPVFSDSGTFLRDLLAGYWRKKGDMASPAVGRIRRKR